MRDARKCPICIRIQREYQRDLKSGLIANVAQLVEQFPCNEQVAGSIPAISSEAVV